MPGTRTCRIGTSGYEYPHWRGIFYPEDLPRKRWFGFFVEHYDTVEVNNTFYRLPAERVFDAWREQAPAGFLYALKFSSYGTHRKRLREPAEPIERYVGRARRLESHLGPILVQLPPRWRCNLGRLADFVALLPASLRWAIEFRDPSWLCPEVFDLLAAHRLALCVHDLLPRHPRLATADFVYLRFHGGDYAGRYSRQFLAAEARRIRQDLAADRDVFAYFNNDLHGHALHNALDLKRYVAAGHATATRVEASL